MVIENLYITCRGCNNKINIKSKSKCSYLNCYICNEPYYISYYPRNIGIYTKVGGRFLTTNLILERTYIIW